MLVCWLGGVQYNCPFVDWELQKEDSLYFRDSLCWSPFKNEQKFFMTHSARRGDKGDKTSLSCERLELKVSNKLDTKTFRLTPVFSLFFLIMAIITTISFSWHGNRCVYHSENNAVKSLEKESNIRIYCQCIRRTFLFPKLDGNFYKQNNKFIAWLYVTLIQTLQPSWADHPWLSWGSIYNCILSLVLGVHH